MPMSALGTIQPIKTVSHSGANSGPLDTNAWAAHIGISGEICWNTPIPTNLDYTKISFTSCKQLGLGVLFTKSERDNYARYITQTVCGCNQEISE